MNLGKLLATGKSIMNGRGSVPYRENKHVYLPKFGSAKNPFATATQTELPKPQPAIQVAVAQKNVVPSWARPQKPVETTPPAAGKTKWSQRLNPMTLIRSTQTDTKTCQRPVQSELSLEKIKVVHNDLADADVEVVPMKSRPARPAARAALPVSPPAWETFGERLLEVKAV
jgi:hypothetical protein